MAPAANDPAFVEIVSVSKSFGGIQAVYKVDLKVRRGEIFAVLGPSGCGKSTLLRIMAGLETPAAGEVLIEGRPVTDLPPYRRPVNMMFQSYALFPHMTVEQNLAFGLKQDRLDRDTVRRRVDRLLDLVQMSAYRRRKPAQLSGGQQQRVALARSLAKEPKLLLLDEPMAALDRKLRAEMQLEIAEIIRRVRVTCIMVTHDQEEAMVMADRLALMRHGAIVQTGRPADVSEHPNSRFSAEFLGTVNLFAGTVSSRGEEVLVIEVPDLRSSIIAPANTGAEAGAAVLVAVRPEKLFVDTLPGENRPNSSPVIVEDRAYVGTHTTYHLRLPGGRMVTATEINKGPPRDLHHGARAFISWDTGDGVILRA
jgi:putrescine transport system ATP-binding protein